MEKFAVGWFYFMVGVLFTKLFQCSFVFVIDILIIGVALVIVDAPASFWISLF